MRPVAAERFHAALVKSHKYKYTSAGDIFHGQGRAEFKRVYKVGALAPSHDWPTNRFGGAPDSSSDFRMSVFIGVSSRGRFDFSRI